MSLYNRISAVLFIETNKRALLSYAKFKDLTMNSTTDDFIERMKLKPDDINKIHQLFNVVTLQPKQMLVTAVALENHQNEIASNIDINNLEEFVMDDGAANQRQGTMCFTTCHSISDKRNLGSNFNLSTNSLFLGFREASLGRIIICKNIYPLHIINLTVDNLSPRKFYETLLTKLILGVDYDFNIRDSISYVDGRMDQRAARYFIEIYAYDRHKFLLAEYKNYGGMDFSAFLYYQGPKLMPPLDGVFQNDTGEDISIITPDHPKGLSISGTEIQIYVTDLHVRVECIYHDGVFYFDKNDWKKEVSRVMQTSGPKNTNLDKFINMNHELLNYCRTCRANMLDYNFNKGHKLASGLKVYHTDCSALSNISLGENVHKYHYGA